jgi:hypothetical protein
MFAYAKTGLSRTVAAALQLQTRVTDLGPDHIEKPGGVNQGFSNAQNHNTCSIYVL